jgi:RNA polymerase sigma-70 factor (ECF subfamily)
VGQVRNALDRLSLEHRTILVLREMENCDYDQIAVLLDVPVGTVRSRLHRARIELRRELSLVAMDD